ncbi:diaminopimelate epimerase [Streptomyces sp. NPDC002276]
MEFLKVHGAGNDFVLLTDPQPSRDWRAEAPRLCARRTGVGADGLVLSTLVDKDPAPVLDVICINADGSLATMCGNALRCVAWTAAEAHGFTAMSLMMAGVRHEATVHNGHVRVTAEAGEVAPGRVETRWQDARWSFDAVHTGTEHVVALVDDVDAVDVEGLGRLVRHHPDLAPVGTNVNFVHPVDPHAVRIRTYERGVEAETLSCGSGAVAAAVIAARHGVVTPGPVTVHNRAGTPLTVSQNPERPGSYWVGGPVVHSFRGELELL